LNVEFNGRLRAAPIFARRWEPTHQMRHRLLHVNFLLTALGMVTAPLFAGITIRSMTPSVASPQPLGTPVTWAVTATGSGSNSLTFQFNVASGSQPYALVSDFNIGTQSAGTWTAQPFTSAKYFHPRPSAAGNGYDAANSGGTNLASTNQKLIDRVRADAASLQQENPGKPIPVDLITTSASGLDPEISPAAAEFQVPRVAWERGLPESTVRDLVQKHTSQRDLGLLGEPRVNVLELNLALDKLAPKS